MCLTDLWQASGCLYLPLLLHAGLTPNLDRASHCLTQMCLENFQGWRSSPPPWSWRWRIFSLCSVGIFPVATHAHGILIVIVHLWEEFGFTLSIIPPLGNCFQTISAVNHGHSSFDSALHSSWGEFIIHQGGSILSILSCDSGIKTQKKISLGQTYLKSLHDLTESMSGALWEQPLICLHLHSLVYIPLVCSENILLHCVKSLKVNIFHIYCFSLATGPVTVKKIGLIWNDLFLTNPRWFFFIT